MNIHPPPTSSMLHTPGFAHYGIAWSPFHSNRLAVASAANYGLIGNGRLHLVSLVPNPNPGPARLPSLALEKQYPTQDGLYDVVWSEIHENQLVTASGDGSLRLWDVTLNDLPIRIWSEHTKEVYSVDWSNVKKDVFCSSSWDGTIKLWTPDRAHSLTTLHAAQGCIYQALFSPHHPDLLSSCSSDGVLRIFDLRLPSSSSSLLNSTPTSLTQPLTPPALMIPPPRGPAELLTLDWNKYRPLVLASGGTDRVVRVWDCRMLKIGVGPAPGVEQAQTQTLVGGNCENELLGHEYAVRKVQWSPHRADVLASASYDMTCRVWTTSSTPNAPTPALTYIQDGHTEFVVGCSWSLYDEGLLASCSWDSKVLLTRV
ncbi:WD40 repeat-like protein [Fomitiporia mediterranea MF3/22]|uniref:WD40 repeat-like protein n=1 Tax=Fomitiporia mediterranea (strain MF3/22) TaxID=694068 RepID=UPI000440951E|nr:WD40 repeat-like protein [Fomitiporia mediterranea MF3/22]EJD00708.1 WD40 repeat-like protein [Fomitiporia mediterranea MF3/22]